MFTCYPALVYFEQQQKKNRAAYLIPSSQNYILNIKESKKNLTPRLFMTSFHCDNKLQLFIFILTKRAVKTWLTTINFQLMTHKVKEIELYENKIYFSLSAEPLLVEYNTLHKRHLNLNENSVTSLALYLCFPQISSLQGHIQSYNIKKNI